MALPSPKDWDSKDQQELLNAATSGWNVLQNLPILLRKYYDWAKPLTFGFKSEDDVNEARSRGWKHVQTSFFAENNAFNDINEMVSTPFGLIDHAGVIKCKNNFLMMMSQEFRDDEMRIRHESYEESVADSLIGSAYANPSDPEYARMKELAEGLTTGEAYTVRSKPVEDEPKPKRGRPPGSKNKKG